MNQYLLLFLSLFIISTSCDKNDHTEIPGGQNQNNISYFFLGTLNGETIDMNTSSEDTLLTARLGTMSLDTGGCANDYFSKIYTYPLQLVNVEIGLMHFFNGPCESQEEIDMFDNAFEPGIYSYNIYNYGEPGIEHSASITIRTGTTAFYDSQQTDNSNSYFEIISSEDASDNFYKKRIIEGKMSCNLKHTLSNTIVQLEDATFRILVTLEK